jgi:hypothetical protein
MIKLKLGNIVVVCGAGEVVTMICSRYGFGGGHPVAFWVRNEAYNSCVCSVPYYTRVGIGQEGVEINVRVNGV